MVLNYVGNEKFILRSWVFLTRRQNKLRPVSFAEETCTEIVQTVSGY
jgi:hypothetical protein